MTEARENHDSSLISCHVMAREQYFSGTCDENRFINNKSCRLQLTLGWELGQWSDIVIQKQKRGWQIVQECFALQRTINDRYSKELLQGDCPFSSTQLISFLPLRIIIYSMPSAKHADVPFLYISYFNVYSWDL